MLDRQPANLTDRRAFVYAPPRFDSNDNLLGTFHRIGGPVNVAGGWFDAGGGYEKFAYTASYADGLMLLAASATSPARYPGAGRRGRASGCSWLQKLWHPAARCFTSRSASAPATRATRSRATTTSGSCRRPRTSSTSARAATPGRRAYFVKYRPVFAAAAPGAQDQPAIRRPVRRRLRPRRPAGRAEAGPARAQHLLALARGVYAMAKTSTSADRDRVPARLLPGHRMEERHALGRRRDRAGRRGARRPARAAAGRPGRGGAAGQRHTLRRATWPAATR